MNIKSEFKDFYDYALAGISNPDNTINFVRNIKLIENKEFSYLKYFKHKNDKKQKGEEKRFFYLLFCGELFKGLEVSEVEEIDIGYYSTKKIIKSVKYEYVMNFVPNEKELKLKDFMNSINEPIVILKSISNLKEVSPDLNIKWNQKQKDKERKEEFKKNLKKIVITNELQYNTNFIINDSLKLINFNKIKEPNIVYQEIEMFLNKKNNIEKEVIFKDNEKLVQHGFDKMSFKKRKI